METYQKTFWKNAHGVEVPVALEDWPKQAKYLTFCLSGSLTFWTEKPNYREDLYGIWIGKCNTAIFANDTDFAGGEKSIWQRPF